jgi:hypothetical protein
MDCSNVNHFQWVYFIPDAFLGERVLLGAWVPGATPHPFVRASVVPDGPWLEPGTMGAINLAQKRLGRSEQLDLRKLGHHVQIGGKGELPCEPSQAHEWFAKKMPRRFGPPPPPLFFPKIC